jgi:RNA polymerase sigma-70 factor (ECF subfamily)
MAEANVSAERFAADRDRLRALAYRMLGSRPEAEDAVQEAFLRLFRAGAVENAGGWLTTVVARICLDLLRRRAARREVPVDAAAEALPGADDPGRETSLADSIGAAMLVVLETLAPAERIAFVLHDVFDMPFEEIAPILGRSALAARQLASRGRRRVRGSPPVPEADRQRHRGIVAAFLDASRRGDLSGLLAVLDPDVVLRADAAAVKAAPRAGEGIPPLAQEAQGRDAVVAVFRGRARMAQLATVDGDPCLVFAPGGTVRMAADFIVENGRVIEIALIAEPDRLALLDIAV